MATRWIGRSLAIASAIVTAIVSGFALHGCGGQDCSFTATCAGAGAVEMDAAPSGADASIAVPPPPGCDIGRDAKDSPACVTEVLGVFVSGSGNDASAGSRSAPLKTIGAAVKMAASVKKPRVYVCEGEYQDPVTLDAQADGVSVYGGWSCADFDYTGGLVKIAPRAPGVALTVSGWTRGGTFADLSVVANDGEKPGDSSIAVVVADAQSVVLRRLSAKAGIGQSGIDAAPIADYAGPAVSGKPATLGGPGTKTSVTCDNGCGTSVGGAGATTDPNLSGGTPGIVPVYPMAYTGAGGQSTDSSCSAGFPGSYGPAGSAGCSM